MGLVKTQELCERQNGPPGLPIPKKSYAFCGRKAKLEEELGLSELRSCVNFEVAVLGSPSLIVLMVSVDVEQLQSSGAV